MYIYILNTNSDIQILSEFSEIMSGNVGYRK